MLICDPFISKGVCVMQFVPIKTITLLITFPKTQLALVIVSQSPSSASSSQSISLYSWCIIIGGCGNFSPRLSPSLSHKNRQVCSRLHDSFSPFSWDHAIWLNISAVHAPSVAHRAQCARVLGKEDNSIRRQISCHHQHRQSQNKR